MRIERRRFLRQTGVAIFTLGASQFTLPGFNRYIQTLAASTSRKLALLVGINQYPNYPHLQGCLTDVELQKELLIHRFGFLPEDILTLTEKEATRENIETAFIEHLTKQATATDIVVFHFSGYGSLVKDTNADLLPALVPVDNTLLSKNISTSNSLLEKTLILLAQSLATDKTTLILDTSYAIPPQPILGNLRVRSLIPGDQQNESTSELAFQEQLRLLLPSQKITRKNTLPILLQALDEDNLAVEERWQGFSAGLFTYSLTQYLWENIPPTNLITCLSQTGANMSTLTGRKVQSKLDKTIVNTGLVYSTLPTMAVASQGYISDIKEKDIQIKLLGLPAIVLQNYGVNSCFTTTGLESDQYLQLRTITGLMGTANWLGKNPSEQLKLGQLVQESIRVIPKQIKLVVALDSSLERIERVDATSAFATVNIVSTVVNPGEQWADCLLGKTEKGYALFTPRGNLIPQTKVDATEAIKSGISRLIPHLQRILASKLSRITLNQNSSLLPVEVSLTVVDQRNQKIWQKTSQSVNKNSIIKNDTGLLPTIPTGCCLAYNITNQGNNPIYFLVLGILPLTQAIALYIPPTQDTFSPSINPGETRIIPNPRNSSPWKISEPLGITEILIICSNHPFVQTLNILNNQQPSLGDKESITLISNPLEVTQAILTDLHNGNNLNPELIPNIADVYALEMNSWVTFSFVINIEKTISQNMSQ